MSISHKDFIFLHFPKTGGSYLQTFFKGHVENVKSKPLEHVSIRDYRGERPFSFGFVRNPFDWYVTWWAVAQVPEPYDTSFSAFMRQYCHYAMPRNWANYRHVIKDTRTERLGLFTQWYLFMFCDEKGKPEANTVLRYEDGLAAQMEELFDKRIFPLTAEQRHELRTSPRLQVTSYRKKEAGKSVADYYDGELVRSVLERDALIFETFDYPKEPSRDPRLHHPIVPLAREGPKFRDKADNVVVQAQGDSLLPRVSK